MHRVALIGTDIKAGVSRQHTLGDIERLVIAQYGSGKAAALHLCELVNQHVTRGHNIAFEAQAAADQKRLAESAAIGEFGKVQLNAFNFRQ